MSYAPGPIEQLLLSDEYWEDSVIDHFQEISDQEQRLQYARDSREIITGQHGLAQEIGNILLSLNGGAYIHPAIEDGEEIPFFGEDEPRKVVRVVEDVRDVISPRWRLKDLKRMRPRTIRAVHGAIKAERALAVYVKHSVDERREDSLNQPECFDFESLAIRALDPSILYAAQPYTYKEEAGMFTCITRSVSYIRAGIGNQGASLSSHAIRNNELADDVTGKAFCFPAVRLGDTYSKGTPTTKKVIAANVIEAHGVRWTHDVNQQPPSPPQNERKSIFGWNPGLNLSAR